ncbi:putative mitochondrial protein [Tanacetum coccineum]|uniref:Mitochondrial protein n=1 Tax=Tanacetum coccineum TaxID=301880 RepID=A0ABQ4ZGS0_9ASTR
MHVYDKRFGEDYPWELYAKEVVKRFDSVIDDPLMELKILKQDGTVKDYYEKFDSLLNRMELSEKHAISLFLGGFKVETTMKSRYGPVLNTPKLVSNVFNKSTIGYQRSSGYKCSGQLHSLEVIIDEEEDKGEEVFEECVTELLTQESPNDFVHDDSLHISIHALASITSHQTIRIRGYVGKKVVHILIDCRSTHNFIDVQTTKRVRCKLQSICPLKVDAADGNSLISSFMCKNFKWTLQGLTFMTDMMVIPLGGCEMLLGVQWLATLGDIQFNFQKLTMEFEYAKSKVLLRSTPQSSLKWM